MTYRPCRPDSPDTETDRVMRVAFWLVLVVLLLLGLWAIL
jgi:hypothetical protein